MNFETSLGIYKKKIIRDIASKNFTFDKLEEMYVSLESSYKEEITKALTKDGFMKRIERRQREFSEHIQNIADYTVSIPHQILSITLSNGVIISAIPGTLRKVIINEFDIDSTHPLFLLLMGYVHTNCLDSVLLMRAIDRNNGELD